MMADRLRKPPASVREAIRETENEYSPNPRPSGRKRLILLQLLAGFLLMVIFGAWLFSRLSAKPEDDGTKSMAPAFFPPLLSAREELFFPDGGLTACAAGLVPKTLNGGRPFFTEEEILSCREAGSFTFYSPLDALGRCGPACALLSRDMMPEDERGSIGMVQPSGWHTVRYSFIDGQFLYNRCHLIGYQLAGENANPLNLITGTRQLNIDPESGMLPCENRTAFCLRTTGYHVLYRVIPWFHESEPLCRGVTIEAMSLEDNGQSLSLCVYLPNAQQGVIIDYATGDSSLAEEQVPPVTGS